MILRSRREGDHLLDGREFGGAEDERSNHVPS